MCINYSPFIEKHTVYPPPRGGDTSAFAGSISQVAYITHIFTYFYILSILSRLINFCPGGPPHDRNCVFFKKGGKSRVLLKYVLMRNFTENVPTFQKGVSTNFESFSPGSGC